MDNPGGTGRPAQARGVMAGAAVVAIAAWFASGGIRPLGARPLETASLAEGDTTKTLVEAQVKLAKKALRLIEDSRQIGAPVRASSEERYLWSRRLLEAQIYLSLGAAEAKTEDVEVYLNQVRGPAVAERVKAFEAHLERMRQMEAWYRPLYERTQMSAFDFAKVEFTRLQAEVWLSREQSRPAEGAKPAR